MNLCKYSYFKIAQYNVVHVLKKQIIVYNVQDYQIDQIIHQGVRAVLKDIYGIKIRKFVNVNILFFKLMQ